MPCGTALVLLRSAPPLVNNLHPWTDRKNSKQILQQLVEVEKALRRP